MKKTDYISAAIIAEADAWIILGVLKILNFNLMNLLAGINAQPYFKAVNIIIKTSPISLPILAVLFIAIMSFFKERVLSLFQFSKFALVGTLNTFIDLGILNYLMFISGFSSGWFYALFKSISFTGAVTNSYFWNKFWSFEKTETKAEIGEYSEFYIVTLIGLLINVGTASLIVNLTKPQFGLSDALWGNVGAILAVGASFLWNFLSAKFIVFKK
ncbi:GtrA family protein [bacterium]|nr:GtrA family protein [bacterium]